MPLYAESVALLRVLQLLRLTRLLRVLRAITALRKMRSLAVLDRLINRHKLLYIALISAVVVVLLAFVVWLLERDTNPSLAHFGDALWWAIVTTTTVGYGDITPQTGLARLLATGLMLMGIGLIAMLASSYSAALISIDNERPEASRSALVADLERLAGLYERGRLSDEEFAAAKHKLPPRTRRARPDPGCRRRVHGGAEIPRRPRPPRRPSSRAVPPRSRRRSTSCAAMRWPPTRRSPSCAGGSPMPCSPPARAPAGWSPSSPAMPS